MINIGRNGSGLASSDFGSFLFLAQVALSGIAILKKSEQKVYSIMRMKAAAELLEIFVFDTDAK